MAQIKLTLGNVVNRLLCGDGKLQQSSSKWLWYRHTRCDALFGEGRDVLSRRVYMVRLSATGFTGGAADGRPDMP